MEPDGAFSEIFPSTNLRSIRGKSIYLNGGKKPRRKKIPFQSKNVLALKLLWPPSSKKKSVLSTQDTFFSSDAHLYKRWIYSGGYIHQDYIHRVLYIRTTAIPARMLALVSIQSSLTWRLKFARFRSAGSVRHLPGLRSCCVSTAAPVLPVILNAPTAKCFRSATYVVFDLQRTLQPCPSVL